MKLLLMNLEFESKLGPNNSNKINSCNIKQCNVFTFKILNIEILTFYSLNLFLMNFHLFLTNPSAQFGSCFYFLICICSLISNFKNSLFDSLSLF